MDPEARRAEEPKTTSGAFHFDTKCHSISFGCNNKWWRIEINPVVTIASALIIWALVAWCMIEPEEASIILKCLYLISGPRNSEKGGEQRILYDLFLQDRCNILIHHQFTVHKMIFL